MNAQDVIKHFLATLVEAGRTDATIECYSKNLQRADRELPHGLLVANAEELRGWVHRQDLMPASRAAYHAALDSFFTWGKSIGGVDMNPMDLVKRPYVPDGLARPVTNDQARWALLETPEPFRLWAILAAYATLRCIEISRLHRGHISAEFVTVLRGKGDQPRTVPTHPVVWTAVRDLPPGPITMLTRKQISTRFLQYALRCGLREVSLHRLRSWHATTSYEHEPDLLAIQRNLGHRRPETTARYIRLSSGQRRAVVEALPTFRAGDADLATLMRRVPR